jgi:flagellar biosynthesis component FlhA
MEFLASNLTTLAAIAGIAVSLGVFLVGLVYGIYKAVTTIRENAKLAAQERQDQIDEAYERGVSDEKQRCADNKVDETDRIKRLRAIAEEAEMEARQKDQQVQSLREEVRGLRQELEGMGTKYEELELKYQKNLETTAGLVADMQKLQEQFTTFAQKHTDCK